MTTSAGDRSRTVLVIGAAGGMCRGINARIAQAGHQVICVDFDAAGAERAAAEIKAGGGDAVDFACDVSSAESVRQLGDSIRDSGLLVDVIVNAAGILDRRYLADHDDDSFDRAVQINLVGPFRVIQEFGPAMAERGWGRIINISSIAGVRGYPYPSYAATKAGLSNLGRSLVKDFRRTGVTVNSICPGVVDTPMVIDEVRRQVAEKVPTGQIITPEEIGALATFLISDDARNINGADLVVDGGATAFYELFD
ncbi:oxidoreductase [Nocardioides aromaticivorans]|uniref:Oxidoreductase n=1 Tax=Nocardioides aromaticivorans TaxID=200618 RepID=A0ABX7PSW4_9ACTN|nr:SDR family oxidoreductase [Nocardioides aromaticivorans]QSR28785.1 oxidoreductase [Nocardioides aromaticivorans]